MGDRGDLECWLVVLHELQRLHMMVYLSTLPPIHLSLCCGASRYNHILKEPIPSWGEKEPTHTHLPLPVPVESWCCLQSPFLLTPSHSSSDHVLSGWPPSTSYPQPLCWNLRLGSTRNAFPDTSSVKPSLVSLSYLYRVGQAHFCCYFVLP